jgi:lipoic acid synthetase
VTNLINPNSITLESELPKRKPEWLKVRLPAGNGYNRLKNLMREQGLHTVCEEAMCPNIGECWNRGTATFLLMGDICTRSCGFCHIKTGRPQILDEDEPRRVAESVLAMNLSHCVLTSVNRDELPNGGAHIFANTIREIRKRLPNCTVEVLIPDFKGSLAALKEVMDARPEILNHNTETVPRLYRTVRPQANYQQTLKVLSNAKLLDPGAISKSGIMVGLGETKEEVLAVMQDLRKHQLDILTIGQYLRPSPLHLPVYRYVHPGEFQEFHDLGMEMGFRWIESGPLVRSSYHAEGQAQALAIPVR